MRFSSFFDNEQNYIYDSEKIEVVSGVARLKAIVGTPEAYAYWKMDDNIEDEVFRDSTENSRDLRFVSYTSANKVAAKINNGLQGISLTSGNCRYSVGGSDFCFEKNEAFSIEFWTKFIGTPTRIFVSKQSNTGNFVGYAINTVSPGIIRVVIRDNVGNVIAVETTSNYNDDIFHHVVFSYDGSSVETGIKIYVDNVLDTTIFISGTLTGSIVDNNVPFQISGRDGNNSCIDSNTIIDEVIVYERELTEAEINFRWNNGNGTQELPGPDTTFPVDNPTIRPVTNILMKELLGFTATINVTGNDNIFGVVIVNGIDKYWNGVNWVDSSGYPECNTILEITDNITSLILSENTNISFKFYIHSENGSTTPELLDFSSDYNLPVSDIALIETTIYSKLLDLSGNTKSGVEIKVKDGFVIDDNITISEYYVSTNTLLNGDWEIIIKYENNPPEFLIWEIENKLIKTNFVMGNRVSFGELTIIEELSLV